SRRLSLSTRALAGLSPLSLHDALPILPLDPAPQLVPPCGQVPAGVQEALQGGTGSGVPEVVLGQLGPLLVQRVVLDQVTGDRPEIGRAHVCTPVTFRSRMPSSPRKKNA